MDALAVIILQTTAAGKKVVNACVIGCAGRRDWDWPPLMARRPPQTGAAGGQPAEYPHTAAEIHQNKHLVQQTLTSTIFQD